MKGAEFLPLKVDVFILNYSSRDKFYSVQKGVVGWCDDAV